MVSLEVYEKLKVEVNQLLSKEENLSDDDEFLLELTSKAKDSKAVLGLAKQLKEEGNVLFKEKKFVEALESYGYAGVILARHDFQEDECRVEFCGLIMCILLNAAACLSKRKEFMQVGQICTIILDFDEKNIKAWYRRAVAAVELGRADLAFWDLLMAYEIDPGNKEVISKLEEVKRIRLKDNRGQEGQDETPLGLGVGLSPLKKSNQIDGFENESTTVKRKEKCNSSLGSDFKEKSEGAMGSADRESHNCPNVVELVVKDEVQSLPYMEDKKSQTVSIVEDKKVMIDNMEMSKERVVQDVNNVCKDKNDDQADPKCRFVNRRRPGSSISISRKDIQAMMNGKTIQCFSSRSGSRMTIRMATKSTNDLQKKNESHEEVKSDSSSIDDGQPRSSKMIRNSTQMIKSQGKEEIVTEDRAHSSTTDQPSFVFKQESRINVGMHNGGKTSPMTCVKAAKRIKLLHKGVDKNAKTIYGATTFSFSNRVFGCRFHFGRKRRDPPEAVHHFRPRKRLYYDPKYVEHDSSMYLVHCLDVRAESISSETHDMFMG